ncbi:tigger transposable element-derived protein 6-like [Gigantopelta aegis]|uniref:tigger transposable element-derived protein 6-like n=1 Tax=Gigantopelta aegis TaxID=1735272 RepID=UPI001B88C08C|nr:tigger transposable element-derived protein 6-like [Gigantopelta aegis]
MLPDRLLSTTTNNKGTKKSKDRITIVLCANADGSDKFKPLVIGKSAKPRCFKNFNINLYVDYEANKKAWMNGDLFARYLENMNTQMKRQKRHILLLMDNAPSHIIPKKLSNIRINFLPPTTTSHLQPLDAGIIQAFKGQYIKMQLQRLVQCIDDNKTGKEFQLPLCDGIRFVKQTWDIVSATTIKNCWIHAGIIPREPHDKLRWTAHELTPLRDLVGDVTHRLAIEKELRMGVDEFLNVDKETETFANLTDDQIVQSVRKPDEKCVDQEDDSDPEPEEVPSAACARDAIKTVLRFIEVCSQLSDIIIKYLLLAGCVFGVIQRMSSMGYQLKLAIGI